MIDSIYVNAIDFSEWLRKQLEDRDLSQADLSRLSGLSSSQVSKLINMQSPPGVEACTAIARALGLPAETVFRAAGLLPPVSEEPATLGELIFLYKNATEEERELILETVRLMSKRSKRRRGEASSSGET